MVPFGHSRQGSEHDVLVVIVDEAIVDFVGDDDQVVLFGYLGDGGEFFAIHNGAGWIAGITDEEDLGARGYRLLELPWCQDKVVGGVGGNVDDGASGQDHICGVRDEAGLRNQHFVAWVEQRLHCQVHRLADADGDEYFGTGII